MMKSYCLMFRVLLCLAEGQGICDTILANTNYLFSFGQDNLAEMDSQVKEVRHSFEVEVQVLSDLSGC